MTEATTKASPNIQQVLYKETKYDPLLSPTDQGTVVMLSLCIVLTIVAVIVIVVHKRRKKERLRPHQEVHRTHTFTRFSHVDDECTVVRDSVMILDDDHFDIEQYRGSYKAKKPPQLHLVLEATDSVTQKTEQGYLQTDL